jgi:HEAT repeat protein
MVEQPRLKFLEDLSRFDGKDLTPLRDIKARTPASPTLLGLLVDAVADDDTNAQVGGSWLLAAYLKDGVQLTKTQIGLLSQALGNMGDGFGRLHICQAAERITVPDEHADVFADFYRSSAKSDHTFLRAWAPSGLFHLASHHPVYMNEARDLVERALSDPAPSVRARARKTLAGE